MLEAVWKCHVAPLRLRKNPASDPPEMAPSTPRFGRQDGQADFGGHGLALGVAGRDGHVGRFARPRCAGRVTMTVALNLYLQIGIDLEFASSLVQKFWWDSSTKLRTVPVGPPYGARLMSKFAIGHNRHRELETRAPWPRSPESASDSRRFGVQFAVVGGVDRRGT